MGFADFHSFCFDWLLAVLKIERVLKSFGELETY